MALKERLDVLLVKKNYFPSPERARRAVMAGKVFVEGKLVDKPGVLINPQALIIVEEKEEFVSRGGEKLKKALLEFGVKVENLTVLDTGASTGGFTEVLLKHGARQVIAVDVGYGVLAWKLRQDARVFVLERTNIRYLEPEKLPELADLVTADLSFISLKKVVPNLKRLTKPEASFILLVKPQFETGREKVEKGGLVKNPRVHEEVLLDLCRFFQDESLAVEGITYSPITGADGNIEFFVYLRKGEEKRTKDEELKRKISRVVEEAHCEFGSRPKGRPLQDKM